MDCLLKPNDRVKPQDMIWRDKGAIGKLDLVVDGTSSEWFQHQCTPMLTTSCYLV